MRLSTKYASDSYISILLHTYIYIHMLYMCVCACDFAYLYAYQQYEKRSSSFHELRGEVRAAEQEMLIIYF